MSYFQRSNSKIGTGKMRELALENFPQFSLVQVFFLKKLNLLYLLNQITVFGFCLASNSY